MLILSINTVSLIITLLLSLLQWVHVLLFVSFLLLIQVVHCVLLQLMLLLVSALNSLIDILRVFIDSVGVFSLCVVLSLFAHFTVKVDHDFLTSKITNDSFNLVSIKLPAAYNFLSFEPFGLSSIDWVHILQIYSVHIHESKENQNSVTCVLVYTESIYHKHDDDHQEKYEWKYQKHLISPYFTEKVHRASDVLDSDVCQSSCKHQKWYYFECHDTPWLYIVIEQDWFIAEPQ